MLKKVLLQLMVSNRSRPLASRRLLSSLTLTVNNSFQSIASPSEQEKWLDLDYYQSNNLFPIDRVPQRVGDNEELFECTVDAYLGFQSIASPSEQEIYNMAAKQGLYSNVSNRSRPLASRRLMSIMIMRFLLSVSNRSRPLASRRTFSFYYGYTLYLVSNRSRPLASRRIRPTKTANAIFLVSNRSRPLASRRNNKP